MHPFLIAVHQNLQQIAKKHGMFIQSFTSSHRYIKFFSVRESCLAKDKEKLREFFTYQNLVTANHIGFFCLRQVDPPYNYAGYIELAFLEHQNKVIEIEDLFINETMRGKGLGSLLVQCVIQRQDL